MLYGQLFLLEFFVTLAGIYDETGRKVIASSHTLIYILCSLAEPPALELLLYL